MILIDARSLRFPAVEQWVMRVAETNPVVFCIPAGVSDNIFPEKFYGVGSVVRANRVMPEVEFWQLVYKNYKAHSMLTVSSHFEPLTTALVSESAPLVHLVFDEELNMIVAV